MLIIILIVCCVLLACGLLVCIAVYARPLRMCSTSTTKHTLSGNTSATNLKPKDNILLESVTNVSNEQTAKDAIYNNNQPEKAATFRTNSGPTVQRETGPIISTVSPEEISAHTTGETLNSSHLNPVHSLNKNIQSSDLEEAVSGMESETATATPESGSPTVQNGNNAKNETCHRVFTLTSVIDNISTRY